ncbi:MAG: DUF2130 domain-containing protein [Oscillospiraceae bacterium]|nr:DUF2130 domain-containing protein [Oscillospiraceae bacterium]
MNSAILNCPKCGHSLDMSDAIQRQIEEGLKKKSVEQSANLRKEYEDITDKKIDEAIHKEKAKTQRETAQLHSLLKTEKESNKELQQKMSALIDELSKSNKDRETAELKAKEKLLEKEKEIRSEARKQANEDNYVKIREQEEIIRKLNQQLTEAKQVAAQGSQQLQGEILELDLEAGLNEAFKVDSITEVKKGELGADIRHIVNSPSLRNCGLILWECKNAKYWAEKWVDKLKETLLNEKAQIGVIVWNSPNNNDDYKQISANIWVIKPRYAVMIATLLRDALTKISIVNRNNEGRDVKTEMVYNYLTSGEFSNRIGAIMETYDKMRDVLEKEKKQTNKRWAEQAKLIDNVTNNLALMGGDLKGIAGKEIIALPEFDG